jgi:isoleucyl-tRNA synthetase
MLLHSLTTTYLSNLILNQPALCVNNAFTYIKIIDKTRQNRVFIVLEKRLSQLFPEVSKADCTDERKAELYEVVERMLGEKLVGLKYTPLFEYFSEYKDRAFRVISDNYVTEEGGTGIVHQAPAFGEDDYRVCLLHGIVSKGEDLPCPVDANGRFTSAVHDFKGASY